MNTELITDSRGHYVEVYGNIHEGESMTITCVNKNGADMSCRLTPAQARSLAQKLIECADVQEA